MGASEEKISGGRDIKLDTLSSSLQVDKNEEGGKELRNWTNKVAFIVLFFLDPLILSDLILMEAKKDRRRGKKR